MVDRSPYFETTPKCAADNFIDKIPNNNIQIPNKFQYSTT